MNINCNESSGGDIEEQIVIGFSDDEDDDEVVQACDTSQSSLCPPAIKPWNHFRWLQTDTSIRLDLSGTDWSPRMQIEAIPSGRQFQHTIVEKKDEKTGLPIPDQKLFSLLSTRNRTLLSLDFSDDLRSFHVMEPDSQRFIAFFTLPDFPQEDNTANTSVAIHNVVDDEVYIVDSLKVEDLSIPIKSANGEELATIMRPLPKWTASQPGLMTLHFSGDDREGLTCRERAIILAFFVAIGIQGMSHWKRSSVGLLVVYFISAILGCFIILVVYIAFRNDHASNVTKIARPGLTLY